MTAVNLNFIPLEVRIAIFDKYILYVGNIEPRKNLVSLLKAYDDLEESLQRKLFNFHRTFFDWIFFGIILLK